MSEGAEAPKIGDLAEVYELLKSDAKLLVKDLLEGISLWKFSSFLLAVVGILSFFMTAAYLYPGIIQISMFGPIFQATLSLFLGFFCISAAVIYRVRYSRLKRKYQALYAASERLK